MSMSMSMSTASDHWTPAPYETIEELCEKSLHPTSDCRDYANILNFAHTKPHLFHLLPDAAFSVLLLECCVECGTSGCTCDKSHVRKWISNLEFLAKNNKLRLTTEFRIVMYNWCESPMYFDKVVENLAKLLPSVMPSVRSVRLLGFGIFSAEAVKYTKPKSTDAAMAVGAITKLFPNVTELRSHVSKIWGPTPNINSLDDDAYPLYGYLLRAYAGQLWHVQMLIPFPKNVTKLFEFLTSVSVNIKHVRPREDLPRIPTRCLRIIELFQIDDSIPWRLFETTNSELNFESLEDLLLEFIHEAKQTADFPGCDIPVHMPRLNKLQVTNSSYVYTDIYSYFRNRDLEMLTILDDPINFKKVKEHALAKAKVFRIGHPTGTLFKSAYSVDMVEHLYNLPSNAEEAVLWHIQHPLPKMIAWRNLRSLRMLASIADKHGLANLLAQLPCLKKLIMDCFSMIRADAKDTRFGDQTTTLRGLGRVIKPKDCSPISESLEHLEFKVQGNFDLYGFCELLARLPNANHVKVNESMLFKIMDMLQVEFRVFREILFVPYP